MVSRRRSSSWLAAVITCPRALRIAAERWTYKRTNAYWVMRLVRQRTFISHALDANVLNSLFYPTWAQCPRESNWAGPGSVDLLAELGQHRRFIEVKTAGGSACERFVAD